MQPCHRYISTRVTYDPDESYFFPHRALQYIFSPSLSIIARIMHLQSIIIVDIIGRGLLSV
jgi:hypothetical protein